MKQINFENCETQDLEILFGLTQDWQNSTLDEWLKASLVFTDYEKYAIEKVRERILHAVDFWNEDELKMQAIAPILSIVDYSDSRYSIFSQRSLKAAFEDIVLLGKVDFMLATGRQKPIQPYFFIHEYKQERKGDADPKGQLLAELLAAQALNTSSFPLYGCYVVGRNWFFMVLEGKKYAVSDAFISSQTDIYQIITILRQVKVYVDNILNRS